MPWSQLTWTQVKRLWSRECLDWQNSQFINIVGKDDVSTEGGTSQVEVAWYVVSANLGWRPLTKRAAIISPHSPKEILSFPPAHPRIVAAVAAHGLLGGGGGDKYLGGEP